ncbi:65-kDa microtubule-associated protein 1-like, partial [Trifolium medium]|nr:65-kDa microtubule-associated protein 1-like [Trifolium medium]
ETWDEVCEILLQLVQGCLDVCKKEVDPASKSRAHLLEALSDAKFRGHQFHHILLV